MFPFAGRWWLTLGEPDPQFVNLGYCVGELPCPFFQYILEGAKRRLEIVGIAREHAPDLCEAETKIARRHDFARLCHLSRAVHAPTDFSAAWCNQTTLFVAPQSLGRNAKLVGRFGGGENEWA